MHHKLDNQLLLGSIMYGRFANAPQEKLLGRLSIILIINL
ncbi:hypothetical protein CAPSP0001_1970 [Capnocytophaga sputigena ATCC 33612]|nr:hypothetical protein CAPSP0001_1970 [Capnocytophaga sputigena ATCC 33612]